MSLFNVDPKNNSFVVPLVSSLVAGSMAAGIYYKYTNKKNPKRIDIPKNISADNCSDSNNADYTKTNNELTKNIPTEINEIEKLVTDCDTILLTEPDTKIIKKNSTKIYATENSANLSVISDVDNQYIIKPIVANNILEQSNTNTDTRIKTTNDLLQSNGISSGPSADDKIRVIDIAPLELRKRFDTKGYVFVHQNLATVNVELNEFIELMRKYDNLDILNGCPNPDTCQCKFRHKRCRLFMMRKYSNSTDMHFFSPSCNGVTVISPSNTDIQNGTAIHNFVQMFQNEFSDRIMDLVSYIDYIVDPYRESQYVVDVTMIADPYIKTKNDQKHESKINNIDNNIDNIDIDNIDVGNDTDRERCSFWHQDQFVEMKTKQTHAYDCTAMFVVSAKNITPHKLMIGRLKTETDISNMNLDQIQEHIVPLTDTIINDNHCSDIGYIIDQRKGYFHRHSDFEFKNTRGRRNIITIRIKYQK